MSTMKRRVDAAKKAGLPTNVAVALVSEVEEVKVGLSKEFKQEIVTLSKEFKQEIKELRQDMDTKFYWVYGLMIAMFGLMVSLKLFV